jgi:hypothetical protein
MTSKLRLRLAIIAALPEHILLERLQHLPKSELIAFRRLYGIRECHRKGKCTIQQLCELRAARIQVATVAHSRRLARHKLHDLRGDPTSMYQTRCQCAACRQPIPPIPFSAHQLLAKLLVPEGETEPRRPRTKPNRRRTFHAA